ncbi:MAG: DEAD/DEAH box helicase family protein [archaeon]|nr:DEAD/DEAH box helicase family protein [archaeon]
MVCRRSTRGVRGGCDEALPDVDISFYKRPRVPCVAVIERLDSNYSRLIIHASGPNSTAPSALQGATTRDPDLMPIKARVFGEVWNRFRFEQKKAFFLKRGRQFGWDSHVSFFDRRSGRFLAGLEPELAAFLDSIGLTQVQVQDSSELGDPIESFSTHLVADPLDGTVSKRQALPGAGEDTQPTPKETPLLTSHADGQVELRDYQVRLILTALKERRCLLKCATGGGKTLVMTALCQLLDQANIVVLCRSKMLVSQIAEVMSRYLPPDSLGRVSGEFSEVDRRVTVATIQSIKKIAKAVVHADVLLVDEVHGFSSTLSKKQLEGFHKTAFRLGFSATPLKVGDDIHNYRLKGLFGPIACDITTQELTASDVLSTAAVRFVTISYPAKITSIDWESAEKRGIYENQHMHQVVAFIVNNQIKTGRVMILVHRLDHGEALQAEIPGSIWISGSDSKADRQLAFARLKASKPSEKIVVILSSIGNTGIDVLPHYLINCAGGGVTEALTIQKIGRGLRTGPDKKFLHYIDFMHETNPYLRKHSELRLKTLFREGHSDITVDAQTEKLVFPSKNQSQNRVIASD